MRAGEFWRLRDYSFYQKKTESMLIIIQVRNCLSNKINNFCNRVIGVMSFHSFDEVIWQTGRFVDVIGLLSRHLDLCPKSPAFVRG